MALFSQRQLGLGAPDSVRWCTGLCPVRQAGVYQLAALGKKLTAYGYKSPDCPVSQQSAGPTVGRIIRARRVARANGQKGHRTVRCAPDSVRCANGSKVPTVGFAKEGKKSAPDSVRWCTKQCPVRQATEGKNYLLKMLSTAPSCLGAIKGTTRRMEEHTKHSLSIIDHSHFILAHLFDILSDLSSVLVRTSRYRLELKS
jgi:hypothetical protein